MNNRIRRVGSGNVSVTFSAKKKLSASRITNRGMVAATSACENIFNPDGTDPHRQAAGARDGAMSCLVGIAARKSIDTGKPVKIASLTSMKPKRDKLKDA